MQPKITHSNKYHAAMACNYCDGIIRHEEWCVTSNPDVYYAYSVAADPTKMTEHDKLILNSLGVSWN